jgi:hypothetical protein
MGFSPDSMQAQAGTEAVPCNLCSQDFDGWNFIHWFPEPFGGEYNVAKGTCGWHENSKDGLCIGAHPLDGCELEPEGTGGRVFALLSELRLLAFQRDLVGVQKLIRENPNEIRVVEDGPGIEPGCDPNSVGRITVPRRFTEETGLVPGKMFP